MTAHAQMPTYRRNSYLQQPRIPEASKQPNQLVSVDKVRRNARVKSPVPTFARPSAIALHCNAKSCPELSPFELKIGTLIIRALGNFHTRFWFFSAF